MNFLLPLFLFFLPWQTRWIIELGWLAGGPWEYGALSLYASGVLLFLIFGLTCFQSAALRLWARIRPWRLGGLVFLFLLWAGLTSFWAPNSRLALWAVLNLILAGAIIFIFQHSAVDVRRLIFAFVLGLIFQVSLALIQMVNQEIPASTFLGMSAHEPGQPGTSVVLLGAQRFLRAYGGLPHPNILAGYLVSGILLLFATLSEGHRPAYEWAALPFLASGLFFTFSRSAWLGLLVGLTFLFWLYQGRAEARRRAGIAVLILLIVFFTSAAFFPGIFRNRILNETSLEARSLIERQTGLTEAISLIRQAPLLGTGIGNYTARLADSFPGRPSWMYQPVHNVLLLIWAEIGLVGLVLLAALIWRIQRSRHFLTASQAAPLFGLATISLFDHYLWSLYPGLVLMAAMLGLYWRRT